MGTGGKRRLKSKPEPRIPSRTTFSPSVFWSLLLRLVNYREKMPVMEVMIFPDGTGYYVCPRCHVTMEREFMNFCDRCGQHLNWKNYKKARKIYPNHHKSVHN